MHYALWGELLFRNLRRAVIKFEHASSSEDDDVSSSGLRIEDK